MRTCRRERGIDERERKNDRERKREGRERERNYDNVKERKKKRYWGERKREAER